MGLRTLLARVGLFQEWKIESQRAAYMRDVLDGFRLPGSTRSVILVIERETYTGQRQAYILEKNIDAERERVNIIVADEWMHEADLLRKESL